MEDHINFLMYIVCEIVPCLNKVLIIIIINNNNNNNNKNAVFLHLSELKSWLQKQILLPAAWVSKLREFYVDYSAVKQIYLL